MFSVKLCLQFLLSNILNTFAANASSSALSSCFDEKRRCCASVYEQEVDLFK